MSKSSVEYSELSGLKIALSNIDPKETVIIDWIKKRIQQLEEK